VPGHSRLPLGLAGPVELALARSADVVPDSSACAGGCRYELKFDGYRISVVRSANGTRLWSRRGIDLTGAFPDLAAAAEFHLREGTVLDGEAVVWADGRLNFDHLQQRLARRSVRGAPEGPPASYVAFDLLALGAQDQRGLTYAARRRRLEQLADGWGPPLEICPSTADRNEAMAWYEDYRAAGIEGLVIKSASGSYPSGRRDWIKVKNRQTREVIVGAVTGSIRRPESVIAGVLIDGDLAVVGRTVVLTSAQSAELAQRVTPAGDDHPWPDEIGTGVFGQRGLVKITKVRPQLVLEVAADPALQGHRYRHALRYVRLRPDMDPTDVDAPA
jgi:ATP-dependent DNA ligase